MASASYTSGLINIRLSGVVACKADAPSKMVKFHNEGIDFQESSSASASVTTAAAQFSSCIFNGSVIINVNDKST